MYYTGVGSRKTPDNIKRMMSELAARLDKEGWTLRTGDAEGADEAFASSVENKVVYTASHARGDKEALELARKYHPKPEALSDYALLLMARNGYQVLGKGLDLPSKFLVCWTPDGCKNHTNRSIKTGGTGQAISIASKYGVPVFNLKNAGDRKRVAKYLNKGVK